MAEFDGENYDAIPRLEAFQSAEGARFNAIFVEDANVTYYRLRGYYVAGSVFETWVSTSSSSSPPSGNTLIDISIIDTWS